MSTDTPTNAPSDAQTSIYVYRNLTLEEFKQWLSDGKTAFRNGRWLNWPEGGQLQDVAIHYLEWNDSRPFKVSGTVLMNCKPDALVNEHGGLIGTEEPPEQNNAEVLTDARAGEDPAATQENAAATEGQES